MMNPFRHAVAAAAFTPTDIASLAAWWDASDESTITDVYGSVSQWDDKSGNGRHASQGTASLQPITGTRTINGLNVIDFTNGDRLTTGTFGPITQPLEIWAVVQFDSSTVGYITEGLDSSNRFTTGHFSNLWVLNAGNFLDGTTTVATALHAIRALFDTTSSELWVDGASEITGNAGSNELDGLNIGGRYDNANWVDGRIAEILLFNDELSAGDVTDLETYLANKWGVSF
jgi:hypothetical protein